MSKAAAEEQFLDINKEGVFLAWLDWMCLHLGQKDYAANMGTMYREGYVQDEVLAWRLNDDMMVVAVNVLWRGQRRVMGLTASQAAIEYPVAAPAALNAQREKFRVEFLGKAGRCINCVLSQMLPNTRTFFMNMPEFTRAVASNDLILFMQIVKTQGLIGTGNKEEAAQKLELMIGTKDKSTLLFDEETRTCDFSRFSMHWRKLRESLRELGSAMTDSAITRYFINALPEEATFIKNMSLANAPVTLEAAINYFNLMIINQRIQLNDCGVVFGIPQKKTKPTIDSNDSTDKKRHRSDGEEPDLSKMCASLQTTQNVLIAEIADLKNTMRTNEDRGGGARGRDQRGRGRGRGERNDRVTAECRTFVKTGLCDYEKRVGVACRFLHSGSVAKVEGIIKPIKFASKK